MTITNNLKPIRILAIDLGMRHLGYAGLEDEDIKLFGVRTIIKKRSRKAVLRENAHFIHDLIEKFDPHLFVIEKTRYPKSIRYPLLHDFGDSMKRNVKSRGIKVLSFTLKEVKEALTGNTRTPKEKLAQNLIYDRYSHHPGIMKCLRSDIRTKKKYWQNSFDALAFGLTGYQKLRNRSIPTSPSNPQSKSFPGL